MTRVALAGVLYQVCYYRCGYSRCAIAGGLYPVGYNRWALTGRLVRWYPGTGNYSHQLLLLVCTLFVIEVLALYGDESTT